MKKRLNSPLTWKQAVDVSMMATTGAKAGAMHTTAMTNVVAQKIEEAGEEPLAYKLPEGGEFKVCAREHVAVPGHGHTPT